jgi:hypothetical protein
LTVTEHVPDARVQLDELGKEMVPVPDCVSVTVPVGDNPTTVAVQMLDEPEGIEEGKQLTVVDDADLSEITLTLPLAALVTKVSPALESYAAAYG